jgi:hypothetical protein
MDIDDEMMMNLLMQGKVNAMADQEHQMMVLTALLCYQWFEGWEGAKQESALNCRCSFA